MISCFVGASSGEPLSVRKLTTGSTLTRAADTHDLTSRRTR